jgi:glutamate N-acetyltransferase/amino-acid N-acetyltransferase
MAARAIASRSLIRSGEDTIAGEDPNWGRIVAAVGKRGRRPTLLAIWFGDILVAKDGEVAPSYREKDGAAYMRRPEIAISVDVGVGKEASTI